MEFWLEFFKNFALCKIPTGEVKNNDCPRFLFYKIQAWPALGALPAVVALYSFGGF